MPPTTIRNLVTGILVWIGCTALSAPHPLGAVPGSWPEWPDGRSRVEGFSGRPGNPHGRIDPKDLRRRQEAFIVKEAGLTSDEAAFFFPLFRELKQKQRTIRRAIRQKLKSVQEGRPTEKDCDGILKEIEALERRNTELELSYYAKWRKKIASSKILRILAADRRFSKQVFDGHVK